jgi:hypothetical protein
MPKFLWDFAYLYANGPTLEVLPKPCINSGDVDSKSRSRPLAAVRLSLGEDAIAWPFRDCVSKAPSD